MFLRNSTILVLLVAITAGCSSFEIEKSKTRAPDVATKLTAGDCFDPDLSEVSTNKPLQHQHLLQKVGNEYS